MASQTDVYFSIADANRRKLLDLLRAGEQSAQQLASNFDITFGAVSQHLKILLESKLVRVRKEGRHRYYRADAAALREVHEWTELYTEFWKSRMDKLGEYLEENS